MITLNQIQQKITACIKESGLTQKTLAEQLGVKQQAISEYINNKSMPALDTLANLCKILDLDANEILCIND